MTLRPTIEPRCDVDARSFFNLSSSIARIEMVPPPITHGLEVTHGLKEIPPRDGESHPSLNRWLAVAIVDGLEVTHGQGCRSGGDPRQGCRLGLPCRILCRSGGDPRPSLPPGVAVPTGMIFCSVTVSQSLGC
uniref:Uncharacterized protein n=1 Tax=Fagus sylvatica TaxID=28930 RepID=A0A2N9IF57_FAGSY